MDQQFLELLIKEGDQLREKLNKVSDQLQRLLEEASGNSVWKTSVDAQLQAIKNIEVQVKKNQVNIETLCRAEQRKSKWVFVVGGPLIVLALGACGKILWDLITKQ